MNRTNIKLVATDMDGTLLNSKKECPVEFVPWIENHPDIKVVIASGRQYYTLEKMFYAVKDRLIFIAENGSLVFYQGKILYKNLMRKEDVLEVLNLLSTIPYATPLLCGVKGAFMTSTQEEEMHHATQYYARLYQVDDLKEIAKKEEIVKLAIYFRKQMAEASFPYFDGLPKHLRAVISGVSWIDVANRDANKGAALSEIQKKYHILFEESMAFGDYFNDAEMLQSCKYSYLTANAHPLMKQYASYQTDSNDENGVMKVLSQF